MKAIVLGATGATGKDLINLLIENAHITEIIVLVRKDIFIPHRKLVVHIVDFSSPERWEHLIQGDFFFSAMGTTLKSAGSKALQWKVDYDYQLLCAQIAKKNNIPVYILVSASNARSNSIFFYSKMKGKLEEAIQALNFSTCIIFRPPILIRSDSDRKGENLAVKIVLLMNKIGLLKNQKPLPTHLLAKSMLQVALSDWKGQHIIEASKISSLL